MNNNTVLVVGIIAASIVGGFAMVGINASDEQKERDAFAKECNARGNIAHFNSGARFGLGASQCLPPGVKP
jgi:hypothetical protein